MMAKTVGISFSSVHRIWRAHGLQPHRVRQFKIPNKPKFLEKLRDVVGLYVDPPAHAIVLSVDEKSQIQALDRTQPPARLSGILCKGGFHQTKAETLLEQDGELSLGHAPFPGRHFSLFGGQVQHQEQELQGALVGGKMPSGLTARRLGRHRATIHREIGRNRCVDGYRLDSAERRAWARKLRGSKIERSTRPRNDVQDRLAMGWSPEQIAGRMEREGSEHIISAESIYRHASTARPAGARGCTDC